MRPRQPRDEAGKFVPKPPTMSDALRALVNDSAIPPGAEAATGKLLTKPEPPKGIDARLFRQALHRLVGNPAGSLSQARADLDERRLGHSRSKHPLTEYIPPE